MLCHLLRFYSAVLHCVFSMLCAVAPSNMAPGTAAAPDGVVPAPMCFLVLRRALPRHVWRGRIAGSPGSARGRAKRPSGVLRAPVIAAGR